MDMNFFDWSYLGTFAGALAAVALIYLFFVVVLTAGVSRLEKRLKRNER